MVHFYKGDSGYIICLQLAWLLEISLSIITLYICKGEISAKQKRNLPYGSEQQFPHNSL